MRVFRAVSSAQKEERPRLLLEIAGEVLAAHDGLDQADALLAERVARHAQGEVDRGRVVDERRIAVLVLEVGRGAQGAARPVDDLPHPLLDQGLDLGIERPDRAEEGHLAGNDVVDAAAVDRSEREHGRLEWVDVPADDRLERGHDLGRGDDGIDGRLRHRGVPALAAHRQAEIVGLGHHRAAGRPDEARREPLPEVEAEDRVHTLERAGGDHQARPTGR